MQQTGFCNFSGYMKADVKQANLKFILLLIMPRYWNTGISFNGQTDYCTGVANNCDIMSVVNEMGH